jgi:hypothetical protein
MSARRLAAITACYRPAEPAEVVAYYREIATAADGAKLYAYLFLFFPNGPEWGSPRPSAPPSVS